MNKVAVDEATKKYWSTYFKEYGSTWVRDIPRRIKQATRRKIGAKELEGVLRPIAHETAKDGSLSIEAAFAGIIDGQEAKGFIVSSFDKEGTMQEFNFHRIK